MMKNTQIRQQSKSPDYGGQLSFKSQKNINSAVSFHLKTENQRDRGEQDHRSPDIGRSQLRQTWQRPRIIHHGLPDVFNQKQKKKYGEHKKDLIHNLDKMEQNSEYNNAQKLLPPLNYKDEEKMSRNPIKPIKKILKKAIIIGEQLKQMPDMSIEKYLKNRISAIRVTECITLEVVKRGHHTGTVKKMLHVPTLQLICVRQQPVESRNTIRDWTSLWQNKLMCLQNSPFINIYNVHFNYPEGAVSILMEYFRGRSLLNLLDITITLPEAVIRQISTEVLKNLKIFYSTTDMHFGGLSPSQIMITEDSHIKLAMGLFYHIPNLESHNIYHMRATGKTKKFDFNSTHSKFMKTSIEKPINLDVQRSMDIFKFGLIMLHAAIGSFQNFEQSIFIHQNLKYIFTEAGQKQIQRQNVCCLIHSQSYLLQITPPNGQTDRTMRKPETQKFISYIRLLKDRFSIHFINFLCKCLSLSHLKRAKLSDLLDSSFIVSSHDNQNRTVKIQLSDLLALGRGWNQENIFESGTHQKLQNFLNHMLPVFEGCSKEVLVDLLNNEKQLMYSLGKEVGLNSLTLGKRIEEAIEQIIRNMK